MRYLLLIALLFSLSGCKDTATETTDKYTPFHLLKIGDSFREADYSGIEIHTQTDKYIWYRDFNYVTLNRHNVIIERRLREVVYAGYNYSFALDFWYDFILNNHKLNKKGEGE